MKEVRKGKFSVRQSKSTVGPSAFGYIIEKHGSPPFTQRFGGLREEDLLDLRDVIDEYVRILKEEEVHGTKQESESH
ncbi:hypothetical protein LCGC14_2815920 [marine sediment metagenome]|uniref:Uncharacterized protein n=1 Tax=marine sediment metagenome TaxID=412755 RepID=A0A0F8YIH1_9ZZZZ